MKGSSIESLITILYEILLYEKHENIIYDTEWGISNILIKEKYDSLQQMHRLYNNYDKTSNLIQNIFKEHIHKKTSELVKKYENMKKNYNEFINEVIYFYKKYNEIIFNHLENNNKYQIILSKGINKLFDTEMNNKPACIYLVLYINSIILNKKITEELRLESINNAFELFKSINDKDIFVEFYQNYLSNRLLSSKNVDIDLEKNVICLIKIECGSSCTNKIEKMINDFMLISENELSYKNYLEENNIDIPCDFNIRMLTYGSWPTFRMDPIIIPKQIIESIRLFDKYYKDKNSSHKLIWIHQVDDIYIERIFNKSKHTINCNVYQAIILLLFNDSKTINYNRIFENTKIDKNIFNKILHSLTCSKYKLLNKSEDTNTISNTELFSVNEKFKEKSIRFKLQCPSLETTPKKEKIEIDRNVILDASIVRIMKSRNLLKHSDLVLEVISQIHMFTPNPKDIKKRIECLIERDYLERYENTSYKYIS